MAGKVKNMAKDYAKGFYQNKLMKSDKNFTRGEYSELISKFNHFTGGPFIIVKKLIKYYKDKVFALSTLRS